MTISLEDTEIGLLSELGKHNLEMTYNAMAPLKALDFKKLVDIHDHEEAFLRNVFLSSLIEAHNARLASGEGGTSKVNIRDVRTAMLTSLIHQHRAISVIFDGTRLSAAGVLR